MTHIASPARLSSGSTGSVNSLSRRRQGVNEARMSMMDIRSQPMKSQRAKRRNSHLVGGLSANVRNTVHSVGGLRHAILPKAPIFHVGGNSYQFSGWVACSPYFYFRTPLPHSVCLSTSPPTLPPVLPSGRVSIVLGRPPPLASCPPFSSFVGCSSRMLRSDDQNRIIVQTIRRLDKHRTAKAVGANHIWER